MASIGYTSNECVPCFMSYTAHQIIQQSLFGKWSHWVQLRIRGRREKEKVRIGKKRCRQVCDLFKEMEGRGGGRAWESTGREGGEGIVAIAMTWNVHVTPGNSSLAISPHSLMGPKPRPVPWLSLIDSKDLHVIWNAGKIGNAWTFLRKTLTCRLQQTNLLSRKRLQVKNHPEE